MIRRQQYNNGCTERVKLLYSSYAGSDPDPDPSGGASVGGICVGQNAGHAIKLTNNQ